ncbi:type VI secretion system Vgr family protein [Hyalangium sp.]|uniref:type VI secretion system Vgr family protein n=1 Tax=Hyalangium sp. TaxID=2028555 RepID=UPI002D2A74C3|nr:type VI secretion system tip protein TssI/VgrG [Hyalangium sp.]HYH98419.1 type VI secretion system tip protein TssI/VgrG [Hyalangium sp.]
MARDHRLVFELQAGPFAAADLSVTRLSGEEALSELFDFQVEFFPSALEPLDTHELLGTQAALSVRDPEGSERFVHGWVEEVVDLGLRHGRPEYRIRIAPNLRQLRHVRRSRIFQHLSVPDIVAKVLKAGHVDHRLALSDSYPKREYCVQYRETDLDFVLRLLESEGIFFFFEHGPDSHVMVLGDAASAHEPLAGESTLLFRAETGQAATVGEHITRVVRAHRLLPGKVALRDFDFERPTLNLTTQAQENQEVQGLEIYDYPGDYVQSGEGKRLSKVRLEELRFGVKTLACAGTCHRMLPGATFSLAEHPDDALNGDLLLVRVRHEGQRQEIAGDAQALEGSYRNEFLTLPSEVPYRPRRTTPRPSIPGIQTATVVGPSGEETQPEAHGRIKIQFHWDREGQRNEQSSCWVRVGQSWAGEGWGASFIARVGQEVVVRFLEGNPDRPLVVGAVYNGSNPPPVALPDERTKSTQRTDSSPGGGGFNEARIEDAAGQEEVYVHAQKDENLETLNDKTQIVRGNETLLVEKDRSREVHGNQSLAVKLEDASAIEGSQTLTVTGNRDTRVKESHSEDAEGNQSITVAMAHNLNVKEAVAFNVGAAAALNIGAVYSVNVALALNKAVGGARLEQIAGLKSEDVGIDRTETIGGNRSSDVLGEVEEEVKGHLSQSAGQDRKDESGRHTFTEVKEETAFGSKELKFKADEAAVVVGDELALLINKSGTVKIWAKDLTVDGSQIKLKGSKIEKKPGGSGQSKSFQEVLDPSVAKEGRTYQGDKGPLSPADAKAFKDGKYTEKVLTQDVKVERLHGGGAFPQGRWVTGGSRPLGLEGKIRMALRPEWGNAASQSSSFTLKAGTKVYEGVVAGQGTGYAGGATQILIDVPKTVLEKGGAVTGTFLKAVFL